MSDATSQLRVLLGAAERATFHASPAEALVAIAQARPLAAGDEAGAERAVLGWLEGVACAAAGDLSAALNVLTALMGAPAEDPRNRLVVAWAASVAASVHRQLGRMDHAEELDTYGLAAADPLGAPAIEGALDCLIGLVSDAVGRGDLEAAGQRLRDATYRVESAGDDARWRPRCRLEWAATEVALATGDQAGARTAAAAALAIAGVNEAPRHQAKSLLFVGLTQLAEGELPAAVDALRESVDQAAALGCIPLIWRPAGLLAALSAHTDPAASARWLTRARTAATELAMNTPAALRLSWLARPDVTAVLPDGLDVPPADDPIPAP